tara:strand:- start:1534 stop:2082 length:549 start_codon:yes stop_codon:yes gene_type:complete
MTDLEIAIGVNPNHKVITKSDFLNYLINHRGHGFGSIKALTPSRLLKTGNPVPDALKYAEVQINWGIWDYSNSLYSMASKEGKEIVFDIKPRQWGQRIDGTPLVQLRDKYYLEAKCERVIEMDYYDQEGNKLDKEEMSQFLPKSKKSSTQAELTGEVVLRDYSLDNLLVFRGATKKFLIKEN